jgi:16S rRNA (cytosine967-C5)-methyltransferase
MQRLMNDGPDASLAAPLAARRVALDVLAACLDKHQSLDDALARHPGLAVLEPRDRAFVRLLLATTLRRLGEIDGVLAALIERPLESTNAAGRQVLRLGAAQLLFLGTPAHAAVDTSVRLVEAIRLPHLKGLANAVLRRVANAGAGLPGERDAARLNTPDWLWESWRESYGEETTRAIAGAHLSEAPLDLSVKQDAAAWAERLDAELLPTGTLRRKAGGNVTELPGFAEGAWWVQDAAAALPVRLLGDVSGKRVADLCAAPGGKTLQLAAAGARVTAVDISARRVARLEDNLKRAGLAAELAVTDASKWTPDEKFDAVLLDAPCSGTGTLRRHPDIAWLKGQDDVDRLSLTQDRLLANAVKLVRPGGTLVYAVCSLQEEEGLPRIAAGKLQRVPVGAAELPGLEAAITPDGDVRTLPTMGVDGFYIARLVA